MKVIIIDDENKARRVLESIIKERFPEITEIHQAANLISGIEIIKIEKPDIVFLDIEMPQHSGLEIFSLLDQKTVDFQLIFVTAYNQFAIDAFKLSAVDYLLKPIATLELQNAVEKSFQNIKSKKSNYNLEALKNVFQQFSLNKIALEIPKGITFVSHDDIYFFEADGMYTKVHFANRKHEVICKPLRHFENQLKDNSFFYRPHRSYLVNLRHLKELIKKDGFQLILDNNVSIPITKNKQQEFLQIIREVF